MGCGEGVILPGSPPGDNPFSFLQADDKPGIFLTAREGCARGVGAPSMRHPGKSPVYRKACKVVFFIKSLLLLVGGFKSSGYFSVYDGV